MSHDMYAAWASSEIAEIIMNKQNSFFGSMGTSGGWSVYAGRESGRQWPLADGVVVAENTGSDSVKIALELKRINEGLHGILTALGQSLAYLEKGYDASVVVIPEQYTSHLTPGSHLKNIIDVTTPDCPVTIYTYSEPNSTSLKPFHNKLECVREIELPLCRKVTSSVVAPTGNISTLWAHMREGMSHPDAFYRFCQSVKVLSFTESEDLSYIKITNKLTGAVKRISPSVDIYKYLSNTAGDTILDKAWRRVWFGFYFWDDLMPIYTNSSPYIVNDTPTKIEIEDTKYAKLFSGRSDSIKAKLVDKLNAGTISEDDAWEEYAKKVRKDAHSYREVIDSGLFHIGFLLSDGNLSDLGYKYVDACERIASANKGIPLEILGAALLQNGQYGAFLHYIHQLSDECFSKNSFAFSEIDSRGKYKLNSKDYLIWLHNVFANDLHIYKTSTLRAGGTRLPFQAEIPILRKLGFIKEFRIGVGLSINWPLIQQSMEYFNTL